MIEDTNQKKNSPIGLALKGAAMGIAEAIPGVSGGTLAFITGIYEELLRTINAINLQNIKLLFSDPRKFWLVINGHFLLWLLVGMGGGLVFGVLVISHLLVSQKEALWGLFFGLVLASAYFLSKDVRWHSKSILLALGGALLSYLITTLAPVSGSDNPIYLFLSGCIAVSALMLPGISGSFILLILGLYDLVINTLKGVITEQDWGGLGLLLVFGLGILTGLFTFARLLSWLFKRYYNATMAIMIGILIGSLNKLWPWKKILVAFNKETGVFQSVDSISLSDLENFKVVTETNLLPTQYAAYGDNKLWLVMGACAAGITLVTLLFWLNKSAQIQS